MREETVPRFGRIRCSFCGGCAKRTELELSFPNLDEGVAQDSLAARSGAHVFKSCRVFSVRGPEWVKKVKVSGSNCIYYEVFL